MKKIIIFSILISYNFVLNSCSKKPDIILIGNINNKINGKIELIQQGDLIQGVFINLDNDKKIELKGVKLNNKIYLQEFAKKNKVTGFFEGKLDNNIYKGFWLNPKRTKKIPFLFRLKNTHNEKTLNISNSYSNKIDDILKKTYKQWLINKIKTDKYLCSEKECDKVHKALMNNEDVDFEGCLLSLPEKIDFIKGDINNDGFLDAVSHIHFIQCDGGNAAMFMVKNLIFLSKNSNEYKVIDVDMFNIKGIDLSFDTIVKNTILGKTFEYDDLDGRCCPSLETKVRLQYVNGHFITKYGKTNKKNY